MENSLKLSLRTPKNHFFMQHSLNFTIFISIFISISFRLATALRLNANKHMTCELLLLAQIIDARFMCRLNLYVSVQFKYKLEINFFPPRLSSNHGCSFSDSGLFWVRLEIFLAHQNMYNITDETTFAVRVHGPRHIHFRWNVRDSDKCSVAIMGTCSE